MLSKLSIQNFQSHKSSLLEFHPNVNIIVGSSDSGKSSLLRSLSWLINNRPSGDSFKSYWSEEVKIELEINNNKITREKTKTKNLYKFNDEVYEAFGTEIPEKIKNEINFSDINFQYQMDAPFLFSKSNGEIAKYINEIINLDIIDRSLSNIEKMKRDYTRKLENERELLKANQEEIKKYNNLNELEIKINNLEKLENDIIKKSNKKIELYQLMSDITNLKLEITDYNKLLNDENKINEMIKLDNKIYEQKQKLFDIETDIIIIKDMKEKLHKINNYLMIENNVNNLNKLNDKIETNKNKLNNLLCILLDINNSKNNLNIFKINLEINEKLFKKSMGNVCLLCGSRI